MQNVKKISQNSARLVYEILAARLRKEVLPFLNEWQIAADRKYALSYIEKAPFVLIDVARTLDVRPYVLEQFLVDYMRHYFEVTREMHIKMQAKLMEVIEDGYKDKYISKIVFALKKHFPDIPLLLIRYEVQYLAKQRDIRSMFVRKHFVLHDSGQQDEYERNRSDAAQQTEIYTKIEQMINEESDRHSASSNWDLGYEIT